MMNNTDNECFRINTHVILLSTAGISQYREERRAIVLRVWKSFIGRSSVCSELVWSKSEEKGIRSSLVPFSLLSRLELKMSQGESGVT